MSRQYRVSIPMSMETKQAIEQLSQATGASFGSTTSSLLEELTPSILRLAEIYKQAKANPLLGAQMINLMANEAHTQLNEEQHELFKKVTK